MFFSLGGEGALGYALGEAKLQVAEMSRIPAVLYHSSAEAACGAAFLGGPVALPYARFDEQTRTEVHEEYLASIEPYRNGPVYAIPGEFVVVSATVQ